MVTVERFLMVHKGKLYELRTDASASSCELYYKNGGECKGCTSGETFADACGRISQALNKGCFWHWRELK